MNTPRQRAEALLQAHGGACSVFIGSHLLEAFRDMERERLVDIEPCVSVAGMLDVRVRKQEMETA